VALARQLFHKLDPDRCSVSPDTLYPRARTARQLVQEHGAHSLLTVKAHQPPYASTA